MFLLVFSAIISGSEVAFFSLSQTEIKKYSKEKNKRLTNAVNLLKSPDKLLANILIVNNLINVAIITLSAYFPGVVLESQRMFFLF